jgi:HAT1-interacting factor 1
VLVFNFRVLSFNTFLKNSTQKLGENAPETADLYFSYGRALLENAIVQSSVLGKEQREDVVQEDSKGNVVWVFPC